MQVINNSTTRIHTVGLVSIQPGATETVPDEYYDDIAAITDLEVVGEHVGDGTEVYFPPAVLTTHAAEHAALGVDAPAPKSVAAGVISTAVGYRALQAAFTQPANAAAPTARYVDFNRGSDSNNGLTPSAAWKNITKLDNVSLSGGSVVALASDSEWILNDTGVNGAYWRAGNINGSDGNPVIITAYDPAGVSGMMPTIESNHFFLAGDWTWDAVYGAWKAATFAAPGNPNGYVRLGTTIFAAFNRDRASWEIGEYYASYTDSFIWIYCPQATDPTTYFGSVAMSNNNLAPIYAWQGMAYTIVDGLKFRNTSFGIKFAGGTTEGNKLGRIVRNCVGENAGIAFLTSGDTAAGVSELIAYNNVGTYSPGPMLFASKTNKNNSGSGRLAWYENTSKHANQCCSSSGGLGIQVNGAAQGDVKIYRNYVEAPRNGVGKHYFDGSGIYFDTGSSNHDCYGNVVKNAAVAYQDNSGKTARHIANISIDCDTFGAFTDADNNNAIDYTVAHNTAIRCATDRWEKGPEAFSRAAIGFWRTFSGTPEGSMGVLRVFNNAFTFVPGSTPECAIEIPHGAKVTTLDIQKNAVFGTFSTGVVANTYSPYQDITTTAATDSIVLSDDPFVGASAIDTSGILAGAGVMRAVYKDALGNDYKRVPSIGAIET